MWGTAAAAASAASWQAGGRQLPHAASQGKAEAGRLRHQGASAFTAAAAAAAAAAPYKCSGTGQTK